MNVGGVPYRSIRLARDAHAVEAVDQVLLPHEFTHFRMERVEDAAHAIRELRVRGAPLIGATAAYGVALAMAHDPSDDGLEGALELLAGTRPTAVNLQWALLCAERRLTRLEPGARATAAYALAGEICDEDVTRNEAMGRHGVRLIEEVAERHSGRTVRVLTHCNAGWLATVDRGTATAPVYQAFDDGMDILVWVDETRPVLQGARLTAWELGSHGVPHRIVADAAAGRLMQTGRVDLVLVGTDRTTANGDVANKIGTYPLALAAADNGVPFYVAAPSPSIDWSAHCGEEIPIEEREQDEVTSVVGRGPDGRSTRVRVAAPGSPALNVAFDVTPARLVTGLITERGVSEATPEALASMFPDRAAARPKVVDR